MELLNRAAGTHLLRACLSCRAGRIAPATSNRPTGAVSGPESFSATGLADYAENFRHGMPTT